MSTMNKLLGPRTLAHAAKSTRLELNAARLLDLAKELLDEVRENELGTEPIFDGNFCLRSEVRRFEENLIRSALKIARGNQKYAAELLGVKYTTLYSKVGILGLDQQEVARNGR